MAQPPRMTAHLYFTKVRLKGTYFLCEKKLDNTERMRLAAHLTMALTAHKDALMRFLWAADDCAITPQRERPVPDPGRCWARVSSVFIG